MNLNINYKLYKKIPYSYIDHFQVFSYLPITVSIEDVNDNVPEFVNAPYGPIVVDELAPPGMIIQTPINIWNLIENRI